MIKKLFQMPVWGLLLVIAGLAVVVLLIFSSLNPWNPMQYFGKPSTTINTDRTSVIKEIHSLQRLETASFSIEKIIEAGTEGNAFQEILYGDRLLLISHGKVIAGVDLSSLQEDSIEISGNTLEITTPPSEIFSSFLDNSKTKVYDRQRGFLSQGDKNLESEARQAAERAILEAACQGDILTVAAENAEKQLVEIFSLAGFDEVVVNVSVGVCR